MSAEKSETATELDTLLQALATADRYGDGEIDWKDFCIFCDSHEISENDRKSIWKQLGGDSEYEENSKILFQDSFISNDNVFQSQSDPDDEEEHESNELILEFEISECNDNEEIIENNNNNESTPLETLKSPYNALCDISHLFSKYDTQQNGTLLESEFISMITFLYPNIERNTASELFKILDIDDCGLFCYKSGNNVDIFQNKLNNYASNMLCAREFCLELKNIYFDNDIESDNSIDRSSDTEYDCRTNAISMANKLKKEFDYALSLNIKDTSLLSSLWQWIATYGIEAINDNGYLRKERMNIARKNELLQGEIGEYKERMNSMKYTLNTTEKDRNNLQYELQQMAMQLFQEQNLSDSNHHEIDKLKYTIKSLKKKPNNNRRKQVMIESQNKVYAQDIDDDGDGYRVNKLYRDCSYELQLRNESEHRLVSNDELKDYIQSPPAVCRRKTVLIDGTEALDNVSLTTNVESEDGMYMIMNDTIQNSLDLQHDKLDTIIDLVKKLDDNELKQNMKCVDNKLSKILQNENEESGSANNVFDKFRNVVPFIMMGILCVSGYKTYKYLARK